MPTCFQPPFASSNVPAGIGMLVETLRQLLIWTVAGTASCVPVGSMSKPYSVRVMAGSGAGIWSRFRIGVTVIGVGAASAPAGMTSVMSPCESVTFPPPGPMVTVFGSCWTT